MDHPATEAARHLKPLLAAHAKALREGRADDLQQLNPRIQHALGILSALATGPLPQSLADELRQLMVLAGSARPWVARRQANVQVSLAALAQGNERLRQRQEMGTYGARGGFAAGGPRSTGFGRA